METSVLSARGVGERLATVLSCGGTTLSSRNSEQPLGTYPDLRVGDYLTSVGWRPGMVLTSCKAQASPSWRRLPMPGAATSIHAEPWLSQPCAQRHPRHKSQQPPQLHEDRYPRDRVEVRAREEAAESRVEGGGAHRDSQAGSSCSEPSISHLDICSGKGVTRGGEPQKAQVKTVLWWEGTQSGKDRYTEPRR